MSPGICLQEHGACKGHDLVVGPNSVRPREACSALAGCAIVAATIALRLVIKGKAHGPDGTVRANLLTSVW